MKIAIIFPGYGSQFVGMAKELYDESRLIQEHFEQASSCLDANFIKLCFASSDAELAKMSNAYPATFLVSVSLLKLLEQEGLKPTVFAGFNFGEWAALCAAGSFTAPDGLYLLNKFAHFYQQALADMDIIMLQVLGVKTKKLMQVLESYPDISLAITETESSHIIGGERKQIDKICNQLEQSDKKIKTKTVDSAIGLHSLAMQEVVDQFQMYLEKVDFKDPQIPVISSITQKEIKTGKQVKKQVLALLQEPINWRKTMKKFKDADYIIEIGPGSYLGTLAKQQYPDKVILSINKKADVENIKEIFELNKQVEQEQVAPQEDTVHPEVAQQNRENTQSSTE